MDCRSGKEIHFRDLKKKKEADIEQCKDCVYISALFNNCGMSNICSFFLSSLAVLSVEPGTEGCPLVFYGKQKFYYAQAQPTHFQYFCLYLLLFKFYFVI